MTEAEQQKFDEWYKQLEECAAQYNLDTGEQSEWESYYTDGLSPEEAVNAERVVVSEEEAKQEQEEKRAAVKEEPKKPEPKVEPKPKKDDGPLDKR